ncbi:MAG TPA: TraM recognition domain-containing protein [Bacteroidia bacterium]|nr:TraM recognition domain-containing protein [Bacteroidia bacterium]HRH07620.1 TraM recognition domain-containing protein [Bacteroidia bacterium]
MNNFDLDNTLIEFHTASGLSPWTIRNAVEGVQIFGGIGSGKTSGSGRLIALKFLNNGFGGLVLTAKPDERILWTEYCKQTNRLNDLIIIEPNGKNIFNFLDFEYKNSSLLNNSTDNIVQVLKTVIRAGEEKSASKSDDPFWESALDMLLCSIIDLCILAYNKLSIRDVFEVVQTIPKYEDVLKAEMASKNKDGNKKAEEEEAEETAYTKAYKAAQNKVLAQVDAWRDAQPPEIVEKLREGNAMEEAIDSNIPDARLFRDLAHFFKEQYIPLSEKTRSIVDFSFTAFLSRFLRDPIYSTFCKETSNVTPNDSLNGKIILIDFPVKKFHKIGHDVQILFKYIWQRAMEKRDINQNPRPVFLWADEAQNFLHEHDADYQATARSSKIATVYISQNLPNYYANMGGGKAEYKVKSFLGTLGTKIFHANADIVTNNYASELIGEAEAESTSETDTVGDSLSHGETRSISFQKRLRPESMIRLRTGGPQYNFIVDGILHHQGRLFINNKGKGYAKIAFSQK